MPSTASPRRASSATAEDVGSYEKLREERIKENLERIQKLGIINLSLSLKSSPRGSAGDGAVVSHCSGRRRNALPSIVPHGPATGKLLPPPPPPPPRRSSRLQNSTPVIYAEICAEKKEKSAKKGLPLIAQGEREEVYTDEHAALLGSCETSWTLFVDGYDNDGKRIYDQVKGKTCHQCRQKTLGHHTHCNRCNLVQGQFCGDCLYMRYGENVLEVEKNVNWICPVCRGICNCSLCRTKKGWAPTGALYKKVLNLGYKSVAHYLIQTRRNQTNSGDQISDQEFVSFSNIEKSSELNTLESEVGLDSEIADKNSNDSQELLPLSNERETSRANTLDSKTGLSSEITDKNSNDSEELVLVFSTVQEISELNSLDSETGLNSEVADKNSNISRESTVKPKGRNKKLKDAGSFEKLRSDSIASRLRKRVKVTTD